MEFYILQLMGLALAGVSVAALVLFADTNTGRLLAVFRRRT